METRRGAVEVKVRADRDVPENMVFMPFCYAEAAANLLTNPALDPFGKIPEFKFCAVRAEKAEMQYGGGVGVLAPLPVIASEAKQSILSFCGGMDCFASLAMTALRGTRDAPTAIRRAGIARTALRMRPGSRRSR